MLQAVQDELGKAVVEANALNDVFQETQPSLIAMLERLSEFFPDNAPSRVRASPILT